MPEVQADLIISTGETQSNLRTTVQLMNDVQKTVKKTSTDSQTSFKGTTQEINNFNKKVSESIGIIAQLKAKITDLRQRRDFAATTQEAERLTEEIRGTETQVKQLEGTLDAFGKRQQRGLANLTEGFFSVGQGIIGVTNLIGILGDKGEKDNQALIQATRLLVIAESARSVVVGFLKAQELAAILVSKLQASANVAQAVTVKATTVTLDEQAVAYAVLAGAKREDIVETDAQALAYVELAGAQNTAVKSTNKLNVSLLANPYVLIAAGILAVIAALVVFSEESDKVTQETLDGFQKQLDLHNSLAASRQKALDAELAYQKAVGKIGESEAQRKSEAQKFADEEKRIQKEKNLALLKAQKEFQDEAHGLRLKGLVQLLNPSLPSTGKEPVFGPSEKDQLLHDLRILQIQTDFNAQLDSLAIQHNANTNANLEAATKEIIDEQNRLNNLQIAVIRNDLDRAIAERKQKAKEETDALLPEEKDRAEKVRLINERLTIDLKAIREKAARDAVDILIKQADAEKAIQQRILTSEAENGTNREKLLVDQARAREDLQTELERNQLAREREIQDQAKKNGQNIDDPSVVKAVNDAKLKLQNEFQKIFDNTNITFGIALAKQDRDNANARLNILQDSLENRLQVFDNNAKTEKDALIKQGVDEADIDKAQFRKRIELIRDFQVERIDLLTTMNKNILEATIDTETMSAEAIRKIRLEQLREDRDGAIVKLELIKLLAEASGDTSDATKAKIKELDAFIQQTKNKITTAKKDIIPINWADIFGIPQDFKDQFNAAIAELFSAGQQIWTQAIQAEIDTNNSLIQSNQEVIDSLNQRIADTEQALKDEETLFRQGFASNVDLKKKELAALKAERDKELQDQKKLQQERIKLAKEQQLIDSISQASSIITSGTNLIKTWSTLPFGVGLAAAFAQIATIIAFIGSLKSSAAQVAGPGFRHGGYTGEGHLDEVAGDVHRREFVFTEDKTREFRDVFEKMHRDQPLNSDDIATLLRGTGVALPETEKKSILGNNITLRDHEEKVRTTTMDVMERKMDSLIDEVKSVKKTLKDRPITYNEPDGALVIERGNEKKTIRLAK